MKCVVINTETVVAKQVKRLKKGKNTAGIPDVIWCPFCDHSMQLPRTRCLKCKGVIYHVDDDVDISNLKVSDFRSSGLSATERAELRENRLPAVVPTETKGEPTGYTDVGGGYWQCNRCPKVTDSKGKGGHTSSHTKKEKAESAPSDDVEGDCHFCGSRKMEGILGAHYDRLRAGGIDMVQCVDCQLQTTRTHAKQVRKNREFSGN